MATNSDCLTATVEPLPVVEVCRRLGMSRERVMRRIYDGRLRAEMRYGRWSVSSEALDAYRRAHTGNDQAA